jgi:hypothetical protein
MLAILRESSPHADLWCLSGALPPIKQRSRAKVDVVNCRHVRSFPFPAIRTKRTGRCALPSSVLVCRGSETGVVWPRVRSWLRCTGRKGLSRRCAQGCRPRHLLAELSPLPDFICPRDCICSCIHDADEPFAGTQPRRQAAAGFPGCLFLHQSLLPSPAHPLAVWNLLSCTCAL